MRLQIVRQPRKPKKPTEFSKKLLYVIFGVTGVIIAFTLAIIWRTGDTSPLAYLIPSVFAEVATATGFYYWKARKENEIKLRSVYGDDAVSATEGDDIL
ncbi:hypothetical protein [Sporosarcina sp. SAFN-015]|uniref:hypothetical protein n=1 Tax=Sporosarcina sp. SAFN-015 TaxID=3387274 RepID=UPI003F81A283